MKSFLILISAFWLGTATGLLPSRPQEAAANETVQSNAITAPEMVFQTAPHALICLAVSPDGKWQAVGGEKYIKLWNSQACRFDSLIRLNDDCKALA